MTRTPEVGSRGGWRIRRTQAAQRAWQAGRAALWIAAVVAGGIVAFIVGWQVARVVVALLKGVWV